ncbi:MAG: pyruvate kinase [Bacillota bacterium]
MIRTKIISTLGPATSTLDTLLRLFEAGTNVCRLNFSHGQLPDHLLLLQAARTAAQQHPDPIAILGDLGGPKIRLGPIADQDGTGGMPIAVGDLLHIQRDPITGAAGRVSTTYPHFVDDVRVGDRILIEDGLLRFIATDKTPDEILCTCTVGGVLQTAKGINLPNTPVRTPSVTEHDWQCVDWAIENNLDYLALSFVRHADELHRLRQHLQQHRSNIRIIAKIEKSEALQHFDAILDAADALMIARGDLGVEIDIAQVPVLQKSLIRRCRRAGKPVIVATQMLQSMIENPTPTRAEVSDVANAIYDGTDAIMLSGETSIGKYPVAAVHLMNHIARVTEADLDAAAHLLHRESHEKPNSLPTAVAAGVWQTVHDLQARLVAVWSPTGDTARIFSQQRFAVPVVALSNDPLALRQMALSYGILPRPMTSPPDFSTFIAQVDPFIRDQHLANAGDRIVLVAGATRGMPGIANAVIIHTLGASPGSATMIPGSPEVVELERQ